MFLLTGTHIILVYIFFIDIVSMHDNIILILLNAELKMQKNVIHRFEIKCRFKSKTTLSKSEQLQKSEKENKKILGASTDKYQQAFLLTISHPLPLNDYGQFQDAFGSTLEFTNCK